jgi:dGTPase
LKVGQIARRLAEYFNRDQPTVVEKLGGVDPDTAEAAGLAHDLGHPPFGHIAEEELDQLVRRAGLRDGYEGNAQSFRIVTRLASSDARDVKERSIAGLNLTRTTLDGILKYPWASGDTEYSTKWGFYQGEAEIFKWVRQDKKPRQRSAIAEIMDWADDITFAIHDLLDFYCAGKIPIDRCKKHRSAERERLIAGMFKRKPAWAGNKTKYIDALDSISEWFPFEPEERYNDSLDHRAKLFAFSTSLIRYFVGNCRLTSDTESLSVLYIEPFARTLVEVLKQFIWEYIIENPELAVPQNGQRVAIRSVFDRLATAAKEKKYYLFPTAFSGPIGKARNSGEQVRVVADCIAGMTEKEIMQFHRSLQGLGS